MSIDHGRGHGHAHGHAHGGGRPEIEAVPVRRALAAVVLVVGAVASVGILLWWPSGDPEVDREVLGFGARVEATVTSAERTKCVADPEAQCHVVRARITSGPDTGDTAAFEVPLDVDTPASELGPGDEIILNDAGADVPPEVRYSFADMQRSTPLLVLAAVFAVVVVALGRLRGLAALAGIVISMGVLLAYIFPALLAGSPPLGVALSGAVVIAFATLYLAHGVNDRTTVALVGTLASLALTAALAVGFAAAAELSGLASEESINLLAFAPDLDFRGLLLAAVVIGTLGVLDDVTVTQVSAVWELRRTDPSLRARALYAAGIRIGRDHIASTVNTLVLAYAAAALPLLLLFTQSGLSFAEILSSETVAVEIVQTLVGSIGLVASVPLTTGLACWVVTRADPLAPPDPDGWRREPEPEREPYGYREPPPDPFWGAVPPPRR
jgi:uncharacterized membrane protein